MNLCSELRDDPHRVSSPQPTQIGSAAISERIHIECRSWGVGVDQQPTQIESATNSERICTECCSWKGSTVNLHSELRDDPHRVSSPQPIQIGFAANSEKICSVDPGVGSMTAN